MKYYSLREAPDCIQYSATYILQEDCTSENQLDYLEITSDRTPRCSFSQPLVAHSVIGIQQVNTVIIYVLHFPERCWHSPNRILNLLSIIDSLGDLFSD